MYLARVSRTARGPRWSCSLCPDTRFSREEIRNHIIGKHRVQASRIQLPEDPDAPSEEGEATAMTENPETPQNPEGDEEGDEVEEEEE